MMHKRKSIPTFENFEKSSNEALTDAEKDVKFNTLILGSREISFRPADDSSVKWPSSEDKNQIYNVVLTKDPRSVLMYAKGKVYSLPMETVFGSEASSVNGQRIVQDINKAIEWIKQNPQKMLDACKGSYDYSKYTEGSTYYNNAHMADMIKLLK